MILKDITITQKYRALLDCWYFFDMTEFKGGTKNFDEVHREINLWCTEPQRKPYKYHKTRKRLLILSRGHLKTTYIVGYLLWRFYRNPNLRVLLNSGETGLAGAMLRELTLYYEDGDLQDYIWNDRPHIEGPMIPVLSSDKRALSKQERTLFADITAQKTVWNADMIQFIRPKKMKEPSIWISSANRRDTGYHCDLLINDDLVDWKNSDTPEKAKKIYTQASDLKSVQDPPTEYCIAVIGNIEEKEITGNEVITTGTPYFAWDYNVRLKENAERLKYSAFVRNIYNNSIDDTDGYTFPKKFNKQYLDDIRNELMLENPHRGLKAFSAQYLLKIVADDNALLVSSAVQHLSARDVNPGNNANALFEFSSGVTKSLDLRAILDIATTTESYSNKSCLGVLGTDLHNNIWVVDGFLDKYQPANLCRRTIQILRRWNIHKLTVEAGAISDGIISTMQLVGKEMQYVLLIDKFDTRIGKSKTQGIIDALEPYLSKDQIKNIFVIEHLYTLIKQQVDLFDITSENNEDDVLDMLKIAILSSRKKSIRDKRFIDNLIHIHSPGPLDRRYGGDLM